MLTYLWYQYLMTGNFEEAAFRDLCDTLNLLWNVKRYIILVNIGASTNFFLRGNVTAIQKNCILRLIGSLITADFCYTQ